MRGNSLTTALRRSSLGKAWSARRRRAKRRAFALSYFLPKLALVEQWLDASNEDANFTYDLTDDNVLYLAHVLSVVTGATHAQVMGYVAELRTDHVITSRLSRLIEGSAFRDTADTEVHFGRRLGWYAFARVLKPKVVVETGVDKGHGSVCLCEALRRNTAEGHPGRYIGTDLNPQAGFLLYEELRAFGEILYGDSIESLRTLDCRIDMFVNDSDHSATYEYDEYCTIREKLSPTALILGDNSHASTSLERFSRENGRKFLFFKEVPRDHWYPGAGIGISFV
jgi:hypothetical protein